MKKKEKKREKRLEKREKRLNQITGMEKRWRRREFRE
jgi:hypothetical protein